MMQGLLRTRFERLRTMIDNRAILYVYDYKSDKKIIWKTANQTVRFAGFQTKYQTTQC